MKRKDWVGRYAWNEEKKTEGGLRGQQRDHFGIRGVVPGWV
jgi:hypothetical protein